MNTQSVVDLVSNMLWTSFWISLPLPSLRMDRLKLNGDGGLRFVTSVIVPKPFGMMSYTEPAPMVCGVGLLSGDSPVPSL